MPASSMRSHGGKKGPQAQSAKAPSAARIKNNRKILRRAIFHLGEPAESVGLAAQFGIGAAADEALVEAVGGLRVLLLDPRAGHGEHARLLRRAVGEQRGGLPGEVGSLV